MKKHIIEYLSVLVILPTLCGCTDFLSTRSDSTMVRETFYKTESDLEMALTGSYSNLTSGHNMGTYAKGIQILGEVGTDEAFTSGDREVNALPLDIYSTLNSSNTIIGKFWTNAYAAINRNNEILAAAPNIEDATERLDGIVGETEFLQALWYFNLVRNFGGVPLKTEPSSCSDEFVKVPRDPVSTIYKYIIGLLEDAVEKLPETEYGSQVGRSDKYAAMGLLAKVYLHAASSMQLLQPTLTEDMKLDGINSFEWTDENDDGTPLTVEETIRYYYTKAAEYAKATIDYYGGEQCLELGNLVGEFYPVESTRDVLFEAVFSQGMSPNQGSEFCYLFGPGGGVNEGGGWNIIAPINCVVIPNYTCRYDAATKTWSSNDRRFLWSLSTYKYNDATGPAVILSGAKPGSICKQIRINKFHSDRSNLPPHSLGTGVNNPILRLSDVCLIARGSGRTFVHGVRNHQRGGFGLPEHRASECRRGRVRHGGGAPCGADRAAPGVQQVGSCQPRNQGLYDDDRHRALAPHVAERTDDGTSGRGTSMVRSGTSGSSETGCRRRDGLCRARRSESLPVAQDREFPCFPADPVA